MNEITTGSTAPTSPSLGWLWVDTSTNPAQLKVWDGSSWDIVAVGPAIFSAAGDLLVGTGAGAFSRLALGTANQILRSNGTTAEWYTPTDSTVPTNIVPSGGGLTGSATTFARRDHSHGMPIFSGTLANGDLFFWSTLTPTGFSRLALGSAGQVLIAGGFGFPTWGDIVSNSTPQGLTIGGSGSAGSSTSASKSDHVHAIAAPATALAANGTGTSFTITASNIPNFANGAMVRLWFTLGSIPTPETNQLKMTLNGVSTGYNWETFYHTSGALNMVSGPTFDGFRLNYKPDTSGGGGRCGILVEMWENAGFLHVDWSLESGTDHMLRGGGNAAIAGAISSITVTWPSSTSWAYRVSAN
jgi:hypothetical protein